MKERKKSRGIFQNTIHRRPNNKRSNIWQDTCVNKNWSRGPNKKALGPYRISVEMSPKVIRWCYLKWIMFVLRKAFFQKEMWKIAKVVLIETVEEDPSTAGYHRPLWILEPGNCTRIWLRFIVEKFGSNKWCMLNQWEWEITGLGILNQSYDPRCKKHIQFSKMARYITCFEGRIRKEFYETFYQIGEWC